MNIYPNFINYSDMYNKQNVFQNNTQNLNVNSMKVKPSANNNLYDAYNGFIRGNLFKDLYDPYKLKEPYDVKPMNTQAELLTNIDALGFALVDLNLYLDIYSNDTNMINLFNDIKKEKDSLVNEYESMYGPITLNSNYLDKSPWAWNDMPWPWDN